MEFYQIYNPITATPFACSDAYMEFAPCDALKPYIKCFWGTRQPIKQLKTDIPTQGVVTPDTCMDIIFDIDFTNNRIDGGFCGIDDRTFYTHNNNDEEKMISTFAIRFYAWSAVLFSEESMRNVKNAFYDVEYHFAKLKRELEPMLFDIVTMEERIAIAQRYLLTHFREECKKPLVTEAIAEILTRKGNLRAGELAKELHTSNRQLERLFREYVGTSPKNLASMVRYQYLWADILQNPEFDILDGVHRYGYVDQAHLHRDFKKFHSMNIAEAKRYALEHVAFLQEKPQ